MGLFVLFALGLCGCAAPSMKFEVLTPTASSDFDALNSASENGAVVFNLPVSRISVTVVSANAGSEDSSPKVGQTDQAATPNTNGQPTATGAAQKPAESNSVSSQKKPKTAARGGQKKSGVRAPTGQTASTKKPAQKPQQIAGQQPPPTDPNAAKTQNESPSPASPNPVTITVAGASGTYTISIVPTEGDADYYRATPVNDFWTSNELAVAKFDNTDMPTSVQNTFTDLTSQRITALGQLAVSAASFAAKTSAEKDCSQPLPNFSADVADESQLNKEIAVGGEQSCWAYFVQIASGNHSPGAIDRASLRKLIDGKTVGTWPVTACAKVLLKIYKTDSPDRPELAVPLTIIDPRDARLITIPSKGAITMNSICGAQYTYTPVDVWGNGLNDASALLTQAEALKKKN